MKKFFALNSLLFLSLVFLSPLFFSCSLNPASAPSFECDGGHDGEVVCSIPLDQLQIVYLRPTPKKLEQPDLEIKEKEEEKKIKKSSPHSRYSSYISELHSKVHLDPIPIPCPHCTVKQEVYPGTHMECAVCGGFFEVPAAHKASRAFNPDGGEFGGPEFDASQFGNGVGFSRDYVPDYAPLTEQELATLNIVHTKPVRQSMGMQDCAVHALANALAINSALANSAQPVLAPAGSARKAQDGPAREKQNPHLDIKKLVYKGAHDLYYPLIEKACGHNTYNLSSDKIQEALTAVAGESKGTANPHIFTNIFVVDNVGELPLLEAIREAVTNLPSQPEQDPQAAIHFICNTRPYNGDPEELHGRQAGKHWVTLSLIKQKDRISFYFSDSNHGSVPVTLHPLIRILAERYHIIAPNQNPQYAPPQEQSSALTSILKWLFGY